METTKNKKMFTRGIKENWKDNCRFCLFFDKCQATKTAEECTKFLDNEMKKQIAKLLHKK